MAGFQYDPAIDFKNIAFTKSDLENLLPHWNTRIKEIYQYKKNNAIEIQFLIAAKTVSEVKQWLNEYEEKTKCTYSIRSTDKCSGTKVRLKQKLNCRHNTRTRDKSKRSRNTNCPSSIHITLRAIPRKYRGIDKTNAPDPDMPCLIKLIPNHNHPTSGAEALRYRRVSDETNDKLINLFEAGHSPSSAIESLKMEIKMRCDYDDILADRSTFPDYSYCYHLYKRTFNEKYVPMEVSHEFLEKKVEKFNEDNKVKSAGIKFIDDDYVICLCPPLMQRVHETVEEASEIVFMDSTGTTGGDSNRVYVLLTAKSYVSLPLAILIMTSESSHLIAIGFQLLKDILGDKVFHGRVNGPTFFMIGDSAAEQAAIQAEWPDSTDMLCSFHVLQCVWKWLMNSKNGVQVDHLHTLFEGFKKIMYASDEAACSAAYQVALTESGKCRGYQSFLEEYWGRRPLWALCYRDCSKRRANADEINEAAMRLLTEKIFEGIKTFNLIQVVDFMINTFTSYYERSILDAAHNRIENNLLHQIFSPPPKRGIVAGIQHLSDNIYLVPSEKNSDDLYIVSSEVLICTCSQGKNIFVCKHIGWICCYLKPEKFIEKTDSEKLRRKYYFIATGIHPHTNWPYYGANLSDNFNILTSMETDSDNMDTDSLNGNKDSRDSEEKRKFLSIGRETINEMNHQFYQYLELSPQKVSKALRAFNKELKQIKTASEFVRSFHDFSSGTNPRETDTESGGLQWLHSPKNSDEYELNSD
ncbi:unnamed protein product [Phaedon cochleariae]|uniref:SWIM-type domain-containing protein n=1 Tax=Phaedon cochleariae TaxID=80249 RepID=A0A9N9S954_PHACE|nr:unnamed protein product [Phaedon cochleariae]